MREVVLGQRVKVSTVIVGRQVVVKTACPHCGATESEEIPVGFRRDTESNAAFAERLRQAATQKHYECAKGENA